jgi:hypothetical protein
LVDLPLLKLIKPDTPKVPALALTILIAPLEEKWLKPLTIFKFPPVAAGSVEVVEPAIINSSPPAPLNPDPTVTYTDLPVRVIPPVTLRPALLIVTPDVTLIPPRFTVTPPVRVNPPDSIETPPVTFKDPERIVIPPAFTITPPE